MKNKVIALVSLSFMAVCSFGCSSKTTVEHHYTDEFLFDTNKHWRECTDEGCVQQVDVAIHEFLDWTVVEEPTCSKEGKEISKCKTCDYVLERALQIKDHDVNSGWSNDNNYHWHTCKNDPEEKVDYNAHSFVWTYTQEPTCTQSGSGHQECSVCGFALPEQTVDALGHKWVLDEANTQYATCTEDGVVVHKCSVCGQKEEKVVTAGHGWGQPTYEWNENLSRVTATRVCENNPEHIETESVGTNIAHVAATCDAAGSDTYTTKAFTNPAFTQQTKVIELAQCSETLVHHCEAVKYTAGDIYDECSLCHRRYNSRTCSQPWVDYYFPTEMELLEGTDNGAGAISSFDPETKVATLQKHSGKSSPLSFKATPNVESSVGKTYFVMTYTLLEDSGGWWDTYLTAGGIGLGTKIRFGQINETAVANYEMDKVTFYKNGQVVGWNGVKKGETGTLILDISGLLNGVTTLTLSSDGGVKLRIDYAGFRSSQCDHDISCYKYGTDTMCAGLISSDFLECEECHNRINENSTGLPAGYSSIDLAKPIAVRWSSTCYDYSNHTVTVPNTYNPGPEFTAPKGTKAYVEVTLDWDDTVTDASKANFQLYFMNNELAEKYPEDNMNNHFYDIKCLAGGVTAASNGVSSPAAISDAARYLNAKTGDPISTFEKGQKIVVEVNIGNASIKDFDKVLLCGSNGSIFTVHNFIYC